MNTKLLKQKILDLAIRGKLVPQDPNDEPASELLKRIRAEKEKLIAEGKIKRSKKTGDKPHYGNENAPFEVPNNWKWCKIEDFAYDLQYGTSEKSLHTGIVPVLRMGNISRDGTVDYTDLVYSSNEEDIAKFSLQLNDLLFNRTNSSEWVGKTAIYKAEKDAIFAGYLIRIRTFIVCPDYINFVMNSSYHRHWCNQVKTDAVNQSNINAQKLSNLLVPVPPINEQKRIVSEIGRWMALIDEIETNKQFMQEFIKQAKSKILDFAIHGKLVPQDPKDEPAVELLKRINPNATICDTSHYGNLPKGWCSATIKQLCDVMGGLWTGKKPPYVNVGVIRNTNFSKDFKLDLTNVAYLDVERHQYEKRKLQYGDLILEKSGGSDKQPVGRVILYDNEEGDFSYSNFTSRLRIKDPSVIIPQFLFYALLYAYLNGETQSMQKQTTGIHNLIMDKYLSVSVPVPPINEQNRIVQKIQKIEGKIREISAELSVCFYRNKI